jgi:ABC-2 type transport system ATP-binding protein
VSESALLRADDIVAGFGRVRVLNGVDLAVQPGEIVGIVGENGCGKTTLLRVLIGLHRPRAGVVLVKGRFGFCPQEPQVYDRLTVEENFQLFGMAYGLAAWRDEMVTLLERLHFARDRKTRAERLSGGTRQKLNLALALLHRPEVLLLDEPYQGFDWQTYLHFWELAEQLRDAGRAVVIVTHFISERERLTRILDLADGKLTCAPAA